MAVPVHRLMHALFRSGRPLGGVILALVAGIVATRLRYDFIEPEALGAACQSATAWWCAPRTALIVATQWNLFGILALAAAVAGLLPMLRANVLLAHIALAIAGAGMVLYNASYCAVALVLALLGLAYGRQNAA